MSAVFFAQTTSQNVVLVLSNLALVPALVRAPQLGKYTRGFVYLGALLSSILYHLCKVVEGPACALPLSALRAADYFFAGLVLAGTALYLIPFGPVDRMANKPMADGSTRRWQRRSLIFVERWILYLYAAAIVVALYLERPGTNDLAFFGFGVLVSSVVMMVCAWAWLYLRYGEVPRFVWFDLVVAGVLLAIGALLFVGIAFLPSIAANYWWVHSLWHLLGALGQYYLLEARDGANASKGKSPLAAPWTLSVPHNPFFRPLPPTTPTSGGTTLF